MSDKARQRPTRDYDTPRWEDDGPLLPGNRAKEFLRNGIEEGTGRRGVVKHIQERISNQRRQRFYNEALFMQKASGTPGILPVLDVDDVHGSQPRWYVMPPAKLLDDALGDDATLLDVVTHITSLAGTLAALADRDTFHRDIKPANLFWVDDAPVLGDFGIAAIAGMPSGLTRTGEKLGPANFIAPEMLSSVNGEHERADVYSLAKTLFVLALPKAGPYPPNGTHRADHEEFSLWQHSRSPGLTRLLHVLEAATQHSVPERLTMAEFHDELRAWLARYSADPTRFPARAFRQGAYRMGFDVMTPGLEKLRRDTEQTRHMMLPGIRRIAEALTGDTGAWSEERDHTGDYEDRPRELGDYGWEPNGEDGFVPDGGSLWMATHTHDGRRIVLQAVLDYNVCFTAEAHQGGGPWTLERQWGRTPWQRPRMPQAEEQVNELADDVAQWILKQRGGSHVPVQNLQGNQTPQGSWLSSP